MTGNLSFQIQGMICLLYTSSFDSGNDNKAIHRQLDQILYLTLTNFHAITKDDFDVQDLESIHSRLDPTQHELMARKMCIRDSLRTGFF